MRVSKLPSLRAAPLLAALALGAGCLFGSDPVGPGEVPDPGPDPVVPRIVYLVPHPDSLNGSERDIGERASELSGLSVILIDEHAFVPADTVGCGLVLMSKNVDDNVVRDGLKGAPCGVLFWEENQQQLRMLATIDNDGSRGTVWHTQGQEVYVRPDAPAELRADLAGPIDLYDRTAEMSFGEVPDVPATATVVAEFGEAGGHKVVYAYDRGDTLADGSLAAGRRIFFGLYRDTYHRLTDDGLALFDAALLWALGREPPPSVDG